MRVLFVTPYMTSSCHTAFLRNQTGFGYMVHDIAQYVANTDKVDIYALMAFSPQLEVDGFKIIGRSRWKFLANLRLQNILDGITFNKKYKQSLKFRLRTLYIFASIGQIENKLSQYDIVHIHGCSELTDAAIRACQRKKVPFLVTLHGLNSFKQSIKQDISINRYERDFLKEAAAKQYPVSFISTGNKNLAEMFVGYKVNNFKVISNGCQTKKLCIQEDIRKVYKIDVKDFVFAYVGNISVNKNQIQVARAWMLLPTELREKCKVLFVGKYDKNDELVKFVQKNRLEDKLILCGLQPKNRIHAFYQACNATILTSITEGFGLSIIEGFVYGKPNVTFMDLPAIPDIIDDNAMIVANDRSDEALKAAMISVMNKHFNTSFIQSYAQNFSLNNMAAKYRNLYNTISK